MSNQQQTHAQQEQEQALSQSTQAGQEPQVVNPQLAQAPGEKALEAGAEISGVNASAQEEFIQ